MSFCRWSVLLVAAALLPRASAQFTFAAVVDDAERPVLGVCDLGTVSAGDPVAARFRLRNNSNAPATLSVLTVAGAGFRLTSPASLPVSLSPQDIVDFPVTFQAAVPGGYSAVLHADGVSVLLAIAVSPGFTYEVETPNGPQLLGPAPVGFGSVELGEATLVRFAVENRSTQSLTIPTISVGPGDFALNGIGPAGRVLPPGTSIAFAIEFRPSEAGPRSGVLTISRGQYTLSGVGVLPPLPHLRLQIELAQTSSAQQGSVTVQLDSPAGIAGNGTVTLDFQPAMPGASEPAIVFASGIRTASFSVHAGDSQATFEGQAAHFQTGTTAGTLTFTARFGGSTVEQTLWIAPAPVGLQTITATRRSGVIELQITGYDNTRTAGPLAFSFFDSAGNAVLPGTIRVDSASAFADYFRESSAGGAFALRAVFPVTGNSAAVASVTAQITNSAGAAATANTRF